MPVIFENIETGETVAVSAEKSGRFFEAKLAALVNSSDLSPNSDRGQDFGWRLDPEQKALIEKWKRDPQTIEKVSDYTKVTVDNLDDRNFLAYFVYQESIGSAPISITSNARKEAQDKYEQRVAAAAEEKPAEEAKGKKTAPKE